MDKLGCLLRAPSCVGSHGTTCGTGSSGSRNCKHSGRAAGVRGGGVGPAAFAPPSSAHVFFFVSVDPSGSQNLLRNLLQNFLRNLLRNRFRFGAASEPARMLPNLLWNLFQKLLRTCSVTCSDSAPKSLLWLKTPKLRCWKKEIAFHARCPPICKSQLEACCAICQIVACQSSFLKFAHLKASKGTYATVDVQRATVT